MIEQQVIQDPLALEHEFYAKPFYFSYSGINRLLYSPKLFYQHYIMQVREERLDSHLVDGKIIHALLLDQSNFDRDFIVSPANLPGESTCKIINDVFYNAVRVEEAALLDACHEEILESLRKFNLHQSLKTDQQRLDKIITEESRSYWLFLVEKGSKLLIDQETLMRCQESVNLIRANSRICELLVCNPKEGLIVKNEEMVTIEPLAYQFGFRGQIDNYVIDRANKIVYINDLKTTGKTIAEFPETVEFYKYWIQAVMYMYLIQRTYLETVTEGWQFKITFIIIDKYQQVYPFEVSSDTLSKWLVRFQEVLSTINYHYTSKKYELPYLFATKQVTL